MLIRVLPLAFALALAACGGSSPAAPTPQPPAPPPPPPAPTYPTMIGVWSGTSTVAARAGTAAGSNVCTTSWNITAQSGDTFTGTFQVAGGTTTSCADAGTITGIVSTSNGIAVSLSSSFVATSGCTKTSGDTVYTGSVVGGAANLTASETFICTGNVSAQRNIVIAVSR